MAAISRRGQGGRIYNNTRARVLLRRMCVKPADLTTHSPSKTFAHPRTATRPSRALPLPHAAPTHAGRLRDAFPADRTTHSPPKTSPRPCTATRPSRALPLPHAAPTHAHAVPTYARRLRDARPPKAFARPRTATHPPRALPLPHAAPTHAHAAPTHARRPHNSLPTAQRCLSFRSASGTKKRHRTVHVRCRMSRSTVVAVGHLGW